MTPRYRASDRAVRLHSPYEDEHQVVAMPFERETFTPRTAGKRCMNLTVDLW
jgi:hypothetical protein